MTNPFRQASTLFLLSLCVWTAACTSDPSSNDAGFSERDSSGIRILETTLLGPRVNPREVLRIGVLEGPTELTFNRISDVRVGTDGRLYVLDGGDKLIKVFDRSGSPLYTLGGEGEGPSEFQAPGPFTLAGDSLFVFDWRLGRITIFDHAGALLTTIRVDYRTFTHGFPVALARAPNAGFLIVGTTGGCALPRRPNDNQWRLYALGSDGAIADTLLKDEIRNWIPVYIEARNLCTVIPWPFGSSPSMAFDERGHAFLSTGSAFEIRALDTSLQTTDTIFRYSVTHRPVTPDEREHLRERVFERERIDAFMRRHLEEVIDSVGFPPTWPGIAELKIDGLGRIWASRAAAPEADEREWDVLDNGHHSMTVVLPGNFRVTDVTSDRIVGVLTDDLDVQYVAIFAVPDRPPRT